MKLVNEIIRGLREDMDLKQSDISKVLGIAQQTYSTYETGEYELPSRHLKMLATFYNVSADYLLGITDYKGTMMQLEETLANNVTFGGLISNIMALNNDNQIAVLEYVELLKLKQRNKL